MEPTTGYARLGNDRIAYQVIGDGPVDIVLTTGTWGAFDVEWEDPGIRLFYQQMATYSRLIRFDRRGCGASDPIPLDALPPWESFADEIECVMDAVGSDQAAILAAAGAGPAGLMFAATRPERVKALILYQTTVRYLWDEDYPIGVPQEEWDQGAAEMQEGWGTGAMLDLVFPSRAGDERFRTWYAKLQRAISSPTVIAKYQEAERDVDARSLLSATTVPTLVIHRTDSEWSPIAHGQYMAEHIEGAKLVELPGADLAPYWDRPELTLDAIEEFVTGERREAPRKRQLATLVFTDIVDSTKKAEELGDRRWHVLIELHDDTSRDLIERNAGHLVKTTGDGILATFDGPGRAIRSAGILQDELARVDLEIRIGIHTGEIEIRDSDIGGIAVHLASRIMDMAGAGEILVSSTVHDLVVGSDLSFDDRGPHTLKGIEGEWELYSVV
jgi:class 3 adenylate cyclase